MPRLVEQRAAPAVKACKGVADTRLQRQKAKPIGKQTSVNATRVEIAAFAFRDLKLVGRPPL